MTTISSFSSGVQHTSPKQNILSAIAAQASAGTISSTDQTALNSAVEDIDTSLSGSSASASGRPDPAALKSKVDTLIDGEVTNGKLTSDQASTLKKILSQGPGHGSDGDGDDGTGTTSGTSSGKDASDLLASFLKDLQSSQSSASSYSASGTSGSTGVANSLLFSFTA